MEQSQYYSKELVLGLNPISMVCAILSLRTSLQNAWYKYQNYLLVATTFRIHTLAAWLLNRACCQENQILDDFKEIYPLYFLFP